MQVWFKSEMWGTCAVFFMICWNVVVCLLRAGWVSMSLLECYKNAVQPPGARTRAGWVGTPLLEWLRNAVQPPGARNSPLAGRLVLKRGVLRVFEVSRLRSVVQRVPDLVEVVVLDRPGDAAQPKR